MTPMQLVAMSPIDYETIPKIMKKSNQQNVFKTLFGITREEIKETCVIIPFFSKDILDEFKIQSVSRGLLYAAGNNDTFSLVITKMGAGFVGDAVLYLKDTVCKNFIFLGACGAWNKDLMIGDLVLADKAYSQDSFSSMLLKRNIQGIFYPNKEISVRFLPFVLKGNCLSVASLKLEEEYLKTLKGKKIDVVDMETSAFLSAANYINNPAGSLLYVTDILESNPYYSTFQKENLEIIRNAARNAAKIIYEHIEPFR